VFFILPSNSVTCLQSKDSSTSRNEESLNTSGGESGGGARVWSHGGGGSLDLTVGDL